MDTGPAAFAKEKTKDCGTRAGAPGSAYLAGRAAGSGQHSSQGCSKMLMSPLLLRQEPELKLVTTPHNFHMQHIKPPQRAPSRAKLSPILLSVFPSKLLLLQLSSQTPQRCLYGDSHIQDAGVVLAVIPHRGTPLCPLGPGRVSSACRGLVQILASFENGPA